MQSHFNADKMFTFLRGFANGRGMPETIKALNYAKKLHSGQFRDNGEPYIIHPLIMAFQAISVGLTSDDLIASLLLHDVCEDCGIELESLPFNDRVKRIVGLLTYIKPPEGESVEARKIHKEQYYTEISEDAEASLGKIIDRCNNLSSMSGVFSEERMIKYIEETKEFILPLIVKTKEQFPEYQNSIFILKYHIYSVLEAICCTYNSLSKDKKVSID